MCNMKNGIVVDLCQNIIPMVCKGCYSIGCLECLAQMLYLRFIISKNFLKDKGIDQC